MPYSISTFSFTPPRLQHILSEDISQSYILTGKRWFLETWTYPLRSTSISPFFFPLKARLETYTRSITYCIITHPTKDFCMVFNYWMLGYLLFSAIPISGCFPLCSTVLSRSENFLPMLPPPKKKKARYFILFYIVNTCHFHAFSHLLCLKPNRCLVGT